MRTGLIAIGLAITPCAVAAQPVASASAGDTIVAVGGHPTVKGDAANFTGDVWITPLFNPPAPGRATTGQVTFLPGARSFWHTHPAGQTLIVTAGCGWTQAGTGPVRRICAGDTVWVAPGVRHWHGATSTTSMTHIAVSERADGKNVNWIEPVAPEVYAAGDHIGGE